MGEYKGFATCRHIKTDGEQCQSPAWTGRNFCYYHTLYRHRGKPNRKTSRALRAPMVDSDENWHYVDVMEPFAKRYTLGPIEDGPSLQVAISTVVNALADNRIDMGRASTLLYGLQLAATNLRTLQNSSPAEAPLQIATATPEQTPTAPETQAAAPESPLTASTAGTYTEVPAGEELSPAPQSQVPQIEELAETVREGENPAATVEAPRAPPATTEKPSTSEGSFPQIWKAKPEQ